MATEFQEYASETSVSVREDISTADEAQICAADVDQGDEDRTMDFDIWSPLLLDIPA
jgi:hypothetical protein